MCILKSYNVVGDTIVSYKCGKCPECLEEKRKELFCRFMNELNYRGGRVSFVTLTYSNWGLDSIIGTNAYEDVQKFMKRLRRYVSYHFPNNGPIKFFCTPELGEKRGRFHWHLLLFNMPYIHWSHFYNTDKKGFWKLGTVDVSEIKDVHKTLNYVTKYIGKQPPLLTLKKYQIKRKYNASNNLGYRHYSEKELSPMVRNGKFHFNGFSYAIPQYYFKKIKPTLSFFSDSYIQLQNKKDTYINELLQKAETKCTSERLPNWDNYCDLSTRGFFLGDLCKLLNSQTADSPNDVINKINSFLTSNEHTKEYRVRLKMFNPKNNYSSYEYFLNNSRAEARQLEVQAKSQPTIDLLYGSAGTDPLSARSSWRSLDS